MNGTTLTPDQMTALAQSQATKLRVARKVLPPVIGNGYVGSVPGRRVHKGPVLGVRPNQHLPAMQISRHFVLQREQNNDSNTVTTLINFAAADIALAEDAVVLLGSEAAHILHRLHIKLDNEDELQHQEGLLRKEHPHVDQPILDSILDGIRTLRERGQNGDYYVIVSPDLYEEAYKNKHSPLDAPIYQINALLANQGFLYSEATPPKTGVILSLARNTISLSVPMDTYIDTSLPNDADGRTMLAVAEQFRLVINDPEARAELR
jgi:uncharacterized linocin/CFP29 family protein